MVTPSRAPAVLCGERPNSEKDNSVALHQSGLYARVVWQPTRSSPKGLSGKEHFLFWWNNNSIPVDRHLCAQHENGRNGLHFCAEASVYHDVPHWAIRHMELPLPMVHLSIRWQREENILDYIKAGLNGGAGGVCVQGKSRQIDGCGVCFIQLYESSVRQSLWIIQQIIITTIFNCIPLTWWHQYVRWSFEWMHGRKCKVVSNCPLHMDALSRLSVLWLSRSPLEGGLNSTSVHVHFWLESSNIVHSCHSIRHLVVIARGRLLVAWMLQNGLTTLAHRVTTTNPISLGMA